MRESARPWWLIHLGFGGLIILAVLVLPSGAERQTLQLMASLSVIPAIILGIRLNRPEHRFGWWALVAAVSTAVVSNVTWPVLQAAGLISTSPAVDLLYYLTYPILAFALAVLPALPRGKRAAGFTEAGIIASGAAVVWWTLLVDPLFADLGGQEIDQTHIMVFPLLDMALLALALRLLLLTEATSPAFALIAVGCAALLTADTAMFITADTGLFTSTVNTADPPMTSQVCWLLTNVLIGAGALHPSMARGVEAPPDTAVADKIGASRIYVATVVATPILTGVFLVNETRSGALNAADVLVPVGATALTSALIVVRMRQLNILVRQRATDLEHALRSREALQQELQHRAQVDDMTGLPNRNVLHDRLTAALAARRQGTLLILDLDEFKEVNDRFGHAMGDDLLIAVTDRLSRLADGRGLVVRLGSDEFGLLLEDITAEQAEACAREVLVAIRRPVNAQGHQLLVTASIGLRTVDDDLLTGDVLRDAYLALHAAKANGRDQFAAFAPRMREERLAIAQTPPQRRRGVRQRVAAAAARTRLRIRGAGRAALLGAAAAGAHPGDHRGRAGRVRPGHRAGHRAPEHAARPWGTGGRRRLRHRVLLTRVPPRPADRPHQDRPVLHAGARRPRPGGADPRQGDHRPGRGPRARHHRGRRGNRGTGGAAAVTGVRTGPGVPLRPARPGRRSRRAARHISLTGRVRPASGVGRSALGCRSVTALN